MTHFFRNQYDDYKKIVFNELNDNLINLEQRYHLNIIDTHIKFNENRLSTIANELKCNNISSEDKEYLKQEQTDALKYLLQEIKHKYKILH